MRRVFLTLLVGLLITHPGRAEVPIRQIPLQLLPGGAQVSTTGKISGYEILDYTLKAHRGELLSVDFTAANNACYFNLLPPDSESALHIGSVSGGRYLAPLPTDGSYRLRVYLMRSAARRNETSDFTLSARLMPAEPPCYSRSFDLHGIAFQVTSYCSGSFSSLAISPEGLEIDNRPILRTLEGTVAGAETDDLNNDGSPEIYVYVVAPGSGSYGSLVAYSANNRKSLSEIYLPPLEQQPGAASGYQGHDEFAVLEGVLGRRFPVYRAGDSNAKPTGGMRQLQYKLVPGEAGWLLQVEKVVEY